MSRCHEHGKARTTIEIVAAEKVVTQPPWCLSVAGDDYASSGTHAAGSEGGSVEFRLNPHGLPRQRATLLRGRRGTLNGHVLGADGHTRKALFADQDLDRGLANGPGMQSADGPHADATICVNTFDDHGDLVLVRHDGDTPVRGAALEMHNDAVGIILPGTVSQPGKHLQQQAFDLTLRPGWTMSIGETFEISEQAQAIDGHVRVPFLEQILDGGSAKIRPDSCRSRARPVEGVMPSRRWGPPQASSVRRRRSASGR